MCVLIELLMSFFSLLSFAYVVDLRLLRVLYAKHGWVKVYLKGWTWFLRCSYNG